MPDLTIPLSPRKVARFLSALAVVLAALSVAGQYSRFYLHHGRLYGVIDLLDIDNENSLSTWFQSTGLLACSILLFLISRAERRERGPHALGWTVMAGIFLYLAVDEASRIHEMTIVPLNRAFHARGILLFTWVVPAAGLLVVFVLAYRRFLLDLDRPTRWAFLGAGALYVAGALGMELIEGVYASSHGFDNPMYRMVLVTIEETLEAFGIILFLFSLLTYVAEQLPSVGVRIARAGEEGLPAPSVTSEGG